MNSRRFIHGNYPEDLCALGATLGFAQDARSFKGSLVSAAAQGRDMKQDVLSAVIRNNKAIAFCDIEPFNATGNFKKFDVDIAIFCAAGAGA